MTPPKSTLSKKTFSVVRSIWKFEPFSSWILPSNGWLRIGIFRGPNSGSLYLHSSIFLSSYNEFIICFHECWINETWIFFHDICHLHWSIIDFHLRNRSKNYVGKRRWVGQGLLNRWTSQLDLGCMTGWLERVISVHNST